MSVDFRDDRGWLDDVPAEEYVPLNQIRKPNGSLVMEEFLRGD